MNVDLAKATTDEQKAEIRADYQGKALKALQDMKKDPSFAQTKNSKSSSKSGNKNGNKPGGKSSGSASNKNSKSKANATKFAKALKATKNNSSVSHGSASTAARTVSNEEFAKIKEMAEQIELLKSKISDMSAEDRLTLKTSVQSMISKIKKKVKKNG